jgi:hypothetical protein
VAQQTNPPNNRPNATPGAKRRKSKATFQERKRLDRAQLLLLSALVVAITGILTVLLRRTVQDYIVSPLTTFARFVHSLIDLLSERTQLGVVVSFGSLLLLRFLYRRFLVRPNLKWLKRFKRANRYAAKAHARSVQTVLGTWRETFGVGGSTKLATDVAAVHLRSFVLDAMTRSTDLPEKTIVADVRQQTMPVPGPVRELILGTPSWLMSPQYLPVWVQDVPFVKASLSRFQRPIPAKSIVPLRVVLSYVESISLGDSASIPNDEPIHVEINSQGKSK